MAEHERLGTDGASLRERKKTWAVSNVKANVVRVLGSFRGAWHSAEKGQPPVWPFPL